MDVQTVIVVLMSMNVAVSAGVWLRLGNLSARVDAVENGGACLKHCPNK